MIKIIIAVETVLPITMCVVDVVGDDDWFCTLTMPEVQIDIKT